MDGVFMSIREQQRYRVIEEFISRRITRKECSLKLNLCERQISRISTSVRQKGLEGVKHGNFGRTPVNRKPKAIVSEYVAKYREKYFNFNRSHALEMMHLHEEFSERISYWAFNCACKEAGIGKERRRVRRPRRHRDRHPREGFMVQLDGSPERWFNGEKSCLIALIDDATSKVPVGEFNPTETTWGCMNVMRRLIETEGSPEFVLTDTAGWSTGSLKRTNFSQFVRACGEVDVKVIGTPSAECKGRVERLFRTLQDRVIPELELYKITGMTDANRYLEQVHLPKHNQEMSVVAENPIRAYRPVPVGLDLREVFCIKAGRWVNRDHTIAYKAHKYRLEPPNGQNLWKHWVVVHEYEDESFRVFYDGKLVQHERIKDVKRRMPLLA